MNRLLSIAAELSAPPSSPSCFRDLSLYASVFKRYEVVAVAPVAMLDPYHHWFRTYGLYDHIEDLIAEEDLPVSATVIAVVGGEGARLTAHNLGAVMALL